MGKGYAEGPAAEERFADLERAERSGGLAEQTHERRAVYGSTADKAEKHCERDTSAIRDWTKVPYCALGHRATRSPARRLTANRRAAPGGSD